MRGTRRSQTDLVHEVMGDGEWWGPRRLRATLLERYGVDAEAITARIRELRQRGHEIEARRAYGRKHSVYRMVRHG